MSSPVVSKFIHSIAILSVCFLIAGCNSKKEDVLEAGPTEDPTLLDEKPEIELLEVATGVLPKAVIPEIMYEFKEMPIGETGSHTFTISNQGDGDLKIKAGKTTCKCTLSNVDQEILKKGEETEVTLSWTPKAVDEEFVQTATILTNDPNYRTVNLRIKGRVLALVKFQPGMSWSLGEMKRNEPAEFAGKVFSPILDDLKIEKLESDNEALKIEAVPLTEEELKELKAKSGFTLRGKVIPNNSVGQFQGNIALKLNTKEVSEFKLAVHGHHTGPVKIIGQGWNSDKSVIYLKEFDAEKGKKHRLTMFIDKKDDKEIKLTTVKTDPPFIKFEMSKDDSFSAEGKERYNLLITIPPGIAPGVKDRDEPASIEFETDHELLKRVKLTLFYLAY